MHELQIFPLVQRAAFYSLPLLCTAPQVEAAPRVCFLLSVKMETHTQPQRVAPCTQTFGAWVNFCCEIRCLLGRDTFQSLKKKLPFTFHF